jgi:SAM-dependent methyltransferase
MKPDAYWAAQEDSETEHRRLEFLERRYDPLTFDRLATLDPRPGGRCLEVGAGAGSVARWLAGRVGPHGRVVATDLDPRFLAGLDLPNVEVRRHDILTDALEDASFDLVHCRALLCHLPEPEVALTRMTAALAPGGWLLVEDADFVTLKAASTDHTLAPTWDGVRERVMGFLGSAAIFNTRLGQSLPTLVAGLGLEFCAHDGLVRIRAGGSPAAEFFRRSVLPFRDRLVEERIVSEEEFALLLDATLDPSFAYYDAMSVAAWGRRPLRGRGAGAGTIRPGGD